MSRYFTTKTECSRFDIFPGVEIFTAVGEQMMLSQVEMQPGAEVEPHQHPHEQVGLLLAGELTFTIADETRVLKPGEMWRIPGGTTHSAVAGPAGARAIDIFCPIREDYL